MDCSFQELFDRQEELRRSDEEDDVVAALRSMGTLTGMGVSVKSNRINVYITPENGEKLPRYLLHLSDIDRGVKLVPTGLVGFVDPLLSDAVPIEGVVLPTPVVQPGSSLVLVDTNNPRIRRSCPVGFWASDGENLGVVTTNRELNGGQVAYADTTLFGAVSRLDATVRGCFVKREQADAFLPKRSVKGRDFHLEPAARFLPEGSTVYFSGDQTGKGSVLDAFFDPYVWDSSLPPANAVLTDCETIWNDWGGLVAGSGNASSRYVAGIMSGGFRGKEYIQMYYTKAPNITRALGISIY